MYKGSHKVLILLEAQFESSTL